MLRCGTWSLRSNSTLRICHFTDELTIAKLAGEVEAGSGNKRFDEKAGEIELEDIEYRQLLRYPILTVPYRFKAYLRRMGSQRLIVLQHVT